MQRKEETKPISNKKQITITKSRITETDYTKQILIMPYVEYINTFENFLNKYIVPSINIRLITSFKMNYERHKL
jgi:hypothetical protein